MNKIDLSLLVTQSETVENINKIIDIVVEIVLPIVLPIIIAIVIIAVIIKYAIKYNQEAKEERKKQKLGQSYLRKNEEDEKEAKIFLYYYHYKTEGGSYTTERKARRGDTNVTPKTYYGMDTEYVVQTVHTYEGSPAYYSKKFYGNDTASQIEEYEKQLSNEEKEILWNFYDSFFNTIPKLRNEINNAKNTGDESLKLSVSVADMLGTSNIANKIEALQRQLKELTNKNISLSNTELLKRHLKFIQIHKELAFEYDSGKANLLEDYITKNIVAETSLEKSN